MHLEAVRLDRSHGSDQSHTELTTAASVRLVRFTCRRSPTEQPREEINNRGNKRLLNDFGVIRLFLPQKQQLIVSELARELATDGYRPQTMLLRPEILIKDGLTRRYFLVNAKRMLRSSVLNVALCCRWD